MTDWWAMMNDCVSGGIGLPNNTAAMVRARNDVYMVVDNDGAEHNAFCDNTESSIASKKLTAGELQACARDILAFLLQAPCAFRFPHTLKPVVSYRPVRSVPQKGVHICNTEEKMKFTGSTAEITLAVHQSGAYDICGAYSKEADKDMSQSVCNIMIDKKAAASFDSRSTKGETLTVTAAHVKLERGFYTISLNHTKPGIAVSYVQFSRSK
jgi:beta-glucosidase